MIWLKQNSSFPPLKICSSFSLYLCKQQLHPSNCSSHKPISCCLLHPTSNESLNSIACPFKIYSGSSHFFHFHPGWNHHHHSRGLLNYTPNWIPSFLFWCPAVYLHTSAKWTLQNKLNQVIPQHWTYSINSKWNLNSTTSLSSFFPTP